MLPWWGGYSLLLEEPKWWPCVKDHCNHKFVNKWNLYCISRNLDAISNICYKWTNVKSYDLITVWEVGFRFESLVFGVEGTIWLLVLFYHVLLMFPSHWKRMSWLKNLIFQSWGTFVCLLSSLEILKCFFLVERECLTVTGDLWGWGYVYVFVLLTWNLSYSFSFRRECLDFESLFLRERIWFEGDLWKTCWS